MRAALSAIQRHPPSDWIVWAGAGVSFPVLPLGERLTYFCIDETCSRAVRERILRIWSEANRICATPVRPHPFGPFPRLETVLGAVHDVQKRTQDSAQFFLGGFSSFKDAPSAAGHEHLAHMLLAGATVVTTNFDTCVEKAVEAIARAALVCERSGPFCRYSLPSVPNSGVIVHIHGTADDVRSLGATISAVKRGLSPELKPIWWIGSCRGRRWCLWATARAMRLT